MSLKAAFELLQIASETFEIGSGQFSKGKHALVLVDNKLMLSINIGTEFRNFILDENDLQKDPQQLINEIQDYMTLMSNHIDIKEMN